MKLTLDDQKIQMTINKNTTMSYGLTLVIGLPFPAEIGERVRQIQQQLETLVPDRFTWYSPEQLHATLVAPLRGRYRPAPSLQRAELPVELPGFIQDLSGFFAHQQSFSLDLAGVYITPDGVVAVRENSMIQHLAARLDRYPELDLPKQAKGLQLTIGFFNVARPFATLEEQAHVETALTELQTVLVGQMVVQQIWLVHYANRTLSQLVGKVPFILGHPNVLTADDFLRKLGIY